MKRSIVLFALLAASGTALADGFSYTYLQLNYGTIDIGNMNIDGDGLGLNGSYRITDSLQIADSLQIVGSYHTADFDSFVEGAEWSVGLGVRNPLSDTPSVGYLSDTLDVVAAVSYVNVDLATVGINFEPEDGFGLTVGVRAAFTSMIEINAGVSYVDLSDSGDDIGFGAGVLYNLTDTFSIGLSGSWDDDVSSYQVSGRVYFD